MITSALVVLGLIAAYLLFGWVYAVAYARIKYNGMMKCADCKAHKRLKTGHREGCMARPGSYCQWESCHRCEDHNYIKDAGMFVVIWPLHLGLVMPFIFLGIVFDFLSKFFRDPAQLAKEAYERKHMTTLVGGKEAEDT